MPYQQPTAYQGSFNQQMMNKVEVVKVSGKPGAEAYNLAPNSSILLLDETAPIVWLKTTDGAGYPTVTPYSITPYQPEPPIDAKNLEERIKRLEEIINAKSDAWQNEPYADDATDQAGEKSVQKRK